MRRRSAAGFPVHADCKLARHPALEVGDEYLGEVMPMPRTALLESVVEVSRGDTGDRDCVAAEVVELVGYKREAILIVSRRREPIGPAGILPRGQIGP